ncbi:TIGR01620 family protein [Sulfurospirillum diekertiae]|uniref:DUF697 domain-containing protein n=1 Tax=Sulfurospirillum diekertiae TaxID=1854492 RepID=A0AA92G673_9BACT|nr:TIGR01620 family protein [Sulfurospirillum diekertiae]QNA70465.1 DUF697 domain-containing protein [Sulfurospirillum diekertiae]
MSIIKPFSEIVTESNTNEEKPLIKPFIEDADGGVEITEDTFDALTSMESLTTFQKCVQFLSSLSGLISILIMFVLVALIVDSFKTLLELFSSGSLLDMVYFGALLVLIATLSLFTFKNYQQIKRLKNVQETQQFYAKQKINPDKHIVPQTLELLTLYSSSANNDLKQMVELLESRINNSQHYKEIYKDLDEEVLGVIDTEVKNKIKTASLQVALSTAISPVALLDAGLIVWRSFLLTKEISTLYGFKAGWLSTIVLLKKGIFNVCFAGVTELAGELASEVFSASAINKFSISAGQGLANGVLLARLGFGVMEACRPLPFSEKKPNYIKTIWSAIKDAVFASQKKTKNESIEK